MCARGNEIGDVASRLAAAIDNDSLHLRGMAGENSHRNAGYDFLIAMQQMHLSAFNQRIIVIADVAGGITPELPGSMLRFTLLYVVLRFWDSRSCPAVFAHRVPSG